MGPLERILREAEEKPLLDALQDGLSPTDLQSLMLEVYRARAAAVTPARLLQRYTQDRFSRPAPTDPRASLEFDRLAFAVAETFQPIELSPVCPLGTCSAVATVAQDKVVSTSRNTEVVADATNVLALEAALRRRADSTSWTRLCASHRLVRAQDIGAPGAYAHFRLFSLCTAGRDSGGFGFESTSLREHLEVYLSLFERYREIHPSPLRAHIAVTFLDNRFADALSATVIEPLAAAYPEARIDVDPTRTSGRGYYQAVCFKVVATSASDRFEVADGGFTDWTQSLLNNRKERCLISAISNDRIVSLFGTP